MIPTGSAARGAACLGLIVLLLAGTGCGPRTGFVTGRVTYRQQPLTQGTVTFFCDDGQIVFGLINKDGIYTIPNVPEGRVRGTVATHPPVPPGFSIHQQLPPSKDAPRLDVSPAERRPGGRYPRIPERFNNPDQSGIEFIVQRGEQTHDITLSP